MAPRVARQAGRSIAPVLATALLVGLSLPSAGHSPVAAWTTAPFPTGANEGGAGSFVGPLFFYLPHGGLNFQLLDPLTGVSIPRAPAPNPHGEFTSAAAVGPGGPVFIAIGGASPCPPPPPPTAFPANCGLVDVYDVLSDTWAAGAPMPTPRLGAGAATVNNLVYVVGGKDCIATFCGVPFAPPGTPGTIFATLEIYDPMLNVWAAGPPMPVAVSDVYATAAHGTDVYVFGGWTGVADYGFVQIYDTVAGAWAIGPPLVTPRSNAIAGTCGDHIYLIGGMTGAPYAVLGVVEIFHPLTALWSAGPPMLLGKGEMAAGNIADGLGRFAAVTGRSAAGAVGDIQQLTAPTCALPTPPPPVPPTCVGTLCV